MAERSTVEGAVQSLIFQNEDNGYTVLSLLTDDGELVTVVGCIPCAAYNEHRKGRCDKRLARFNQEFIMKTVTWPSGGFRVSLQ